MELDKYSRKEEIDAGSKPDTATEKFSQIIEKKKRNVTDLTIKETLYGNLNLSVLNEKGFTKIEVLRFADDGYLTSVTNIPTTIRKLILSNQLLTKIELPNDIEHLEIENNLFVGEFSLNNQNRLKYLNISFNQIKSFGSILPEQLEELYCHHNLLQNLYLDNCYKLRVLHCDYNPKLSVFNIPDTVTDIRLPEKKVQLELSSSSVTSSEKEKDDNELQKNYQESMAHYFDLKARYERKLQTFKISKKPNKKMPKCNGCSRPVGMFFSGKNQKYTASCGDTSSPCDWKIVLYRGDNYMFRQTMEEMLNILEETKENIIRQKMDTLFNFISEDKSAELFKDQLSLFQKNAQMVEKYRKKYEDMFFSSQKKEIIQQKKKKIQDKLIELNEYKEKEQFDEVVRIQSEIKGISEFIQREMYEFMEIWINEKSEFILDQEPVIYAKLEINHGEPVKVG